MYCIYISIIIMDIHSNLVSIRVQLSLKFNFLVYETLLGNHHI